jgi:GntR family transcriptional repressor for pyruvate dehydrogenase complex
MQTPQFQSVKSDRISLKISQQIKNFIVDGTLSPGDKLPSERELSKTMGVGRLSLREGFRILESLGILETRYGVGAGTYVAHIALENLTQNLSDILMLSNVTIELLTEARLEISLINLKYFIKNATEEDIKGLEDCLNEAERLLKSGAKTREKSIQFHRLIAQGSKNPIFISLHNSLLEILLKFLSKFESPPDHSKKVLENHKLILKYLKEKDIDKSSLAMRDHILYVNNRLKRILKNSNLTGQI